jgi:predicted nucleic acid-binding protein
MHLVDTSAWIDWLMDSPTGRRAGAEFPAPNKWLVPTMVQLERSKWLAREIGEDRADEVLAFTQTCQVLPMDTRIANCAAELCRAHPLSMGDAVIYATARDHGAELLTCDAHFGGLAGVIFIGKCDPGA